ncbi:MAG: ribosomal RNA small subunit methyltransferase A [Clostridia bacterium]|nr:ribosomal RNA small subunit methyltransferase A [Clostridia bacterium]MBR2919424.1 ribosomal RNA small subunit methyltransferase A [Clostridia bacterium]
MEMKMKDVLQATSFRFNKALGQNFISDTNLLKGIVTDSGITPDDVVVEIGTGAGTLTRQIASVAKQVYSFEVDQNLIPVHELSLSGIDNLQVIFRDVLKMKDDEFKSIVGEGEFKVVANLPYYITTPLIMRFLESDLNVTSLTIMVQEEVGRRLVAKPNTADYSAITLAVLLRGEGTITRKVGRNMFYPAPNVDSAVVRIDVDKDKLAGENKALIHKLVRSAFLMRRKTLVNNLNASFGLSKAEAAEKLIAAGLDERVRGEALSLEDYVNLSHQF